MDVKLLHVAHHARERGLDLGVAVEQHLALTAPACRQEEERGGVNGMGSVA